MSNKKPRVVIAASRTHLLTTLLFPLVLFTGINHAALGQQRYQAMSFQKLTQLPQREGTRSLGDAGQMPNRTVIKVPDETRIVPPFAFNRTDKYVAPNFDSFFPDDPEGGKQLDDLMSGSLGGGHAPEDVLAVVRRGLRHTQVYHSQVLAQVGGFVWGVSEQNQQAIELLYHASDTRGPVSHEGMYYGLTVLKQRPPNVVRSLVTNYDAYGGILQHRIGWGLETYGEASEFAESLDELLQEADKLSDNAVIASLHLYQKCVGKPSSKSESLAHRGKFVVGFRHNDRLDAHALHKLLVQFIGTDAILDFVTRIDAGENVGVCLLQGQRARDRLIQKLGEDAKCQQVINETFSPFVLKYRQLREFADFLPGGLPGGAKPPYEPPPANESFAYNAVDGYHPPDYANFFPVDEAAGKALETLYQNRETTKLTARQQLVAFRNGLRTAKDGHQLCSWADSISGWPQDPLAKEIFYHATDIKAPSRLRYDAVYYGLSGNWDIPPNVLQSFAEILIHTPNDPMRSRSLKQRIIWSLTTPEQKQRVAMHIDKALENHRDLGPKKLPELSATFEKLAGRKPTQYEQFADSGRFAVAFRYKERKTPIAIREFCITQFRSKAYVHKFVVGTTKQIAGAAVVIVKGQRGVTQCVEDLKLNPRIQIGFAGPVSLISQIPVWKVALASENVLPQLPDNYGKEFKQLYQKLGEEYAHFRVKQIDWKAVGAELLPRSETLKTRTDFCLLCQEMVAKLEDSHAYVSSGLIDPEVTALRRFDPGFACLLDELGRPIVYHVDPRSPADQAELPVGSVVTHVNGVEAGEAMKQIAAETKRYSGYSSDRYLKYHVAQWIGRQQEKDASVVVRIATPEGTERELEMKAGLGVRYLPRLPVPIEGITDSANVDWKRLGKNTGYIYVRRIRGDLNTQLDEAVEELNDCHGLIIDVRGNSGGGFDATRSFRNFDLADTAEHDRPKFMGPIAVLIDSRCISAGEGWVSWFRARGRAKFFGTTTAGASARKTTIDILGGAYKVTYSVKAYQGFLDRPIEREGIEPDIQVFHTAQAIAEREDLVLVASRTYLASQKD